MILPDNGSIVSCRTLYGIQRGGSVTRSWSDPRSVLTRTRAQGTGISRWSIVVSTRAGARHCALGFRLPAIGYRLVPKLQYLGDSRDAFKWDLLHWLCTRAEPAFARLVFSSLLTADGRRLTAADG